MYEILCECGKVYVGGTRRQLETRIKEHKVACEREQTEKSAVAEHYCSEEHHILWNDTKVIQHASRTMELVMKEALCIRLTPEDAHFNHDSGYELPCLLYTSPSPRDATLSRMPSSA